VGGRSLRTPNPLGPVTGEVPCSSDEGTEAQRRDETYVIHIAASGDWDLNARLTSPVPLGHPGHARPVFVDG
jgi:hypothetical protein